MGWEERNGRWYYYTKKRQGDKVISRYWGTGEVAEAIAGLNGLEQQGRLEEQERWKRVKTKHLTIDRAIDKRIADNRRILAQVLISWGYYQHKGQWRRKKMSETELQQAKKEVVAILAKGNEATKAELKTLGRHLDKHDDLAESVRSNVNATNRLIETMKIDKTSKTCVETEARKIRQDLGYRTASPLERMLIEQVVISHIRLAQMESIHASKFAAGGTIPSLKFWDGRLNAAQRRHFRAVESLARLWRIKAQTSQITQVNIAENLQVLNDLKN